MAATGAKRLEQMKREPPCKGMQHVSRAGIVINASAERKSTGYGRRTARTSTVPLRAGRAF
jgi:hypothetical protein